MIATLVMIINRSSWFILLLLFALHRPANSFLITMTNMKINNNNNNNHHHNNRDTTSSKSSTSSTSATKMTLEETCDRLVEKLKPKLLLLSNTTSDEETKDGNEEDGGKKPRQLSRQQQQYWICCCGGPGSGKSTFSEMIASKLNEIVPDSTIVVPMDGWHIPKDKLLEEHGVDNGLKRRGSPWTFDVQLCIQQLKEAKTVCHDCGDGAKSSKSSKSNYTLPIYSREISDPIPNGITLDKAKHKIVIVEGLYLLHKEDTQYGWNELYNMNLFDESLYIKCPSKEEQIDRLVKRSLKTWSQDKAQTWGEGEEGAKKRVLYNDVKNMELIEYCETLADEVIINH